MNFIFFGFERSRISEVSFLENRSIAGAQLKYTWRELEPERDQYKLQPLLDDLAFLEGHGKRLFVQLQDVSFSEAVPVPSYLCTDPLCRGGVARQFEYEGHDETKARFDGWVARRWDPAVRERFAKLLRVLGRKLDGRVEGLNLAETSVGFGENGRHHPAGFTYRGYLEALESIMTAARREFRRSHVLVFANFMPGEWLPWTDHGYLRAIYAHGEGRASAWALGDRTFSPTGRGSGITATPSLLRDVPVPRRVLPSRMGISRKQAPPRVRK